MSDEPEAPKVRGRPFQKGQSGNPAGKPKGARCKLTESFICSILADWTEHGMDAVRRVREDRPQDYLKVVASLLPKDINVRTGDFEDLTDDELAGELAAIAAQFTGEGRDLIAGISAALAGAGGSGKPPRIH